MDGRCSLLVKERLSTPRLVRVGVKLAQASAEELERGAPRLVRALGCAAATDVVPCVVKPLRVQQKLLRDARGSGTGNPLCHAT